MVFRDKKERVTEKRIKYTEPICIAKNDPTHKL